MKRARPKSLNMRKLIKLAEMKVLRIEPEDVIVLQTDLCLDKDQVQALRDRASEQFGNSVLAANRVVILTAGLKTGVLRKITAKPKGKSRGR